MVKVLCARCTYTEGLPGRKCKYCGAEYPQPSPVTHVGEWFPCNPGHQYLCEHRDKGVPCLAPAKWEHAEVARHAAYPIPKGRVCDTHLDTP